MAYQPQQNDVVSGEQYRYALTNFRIAHEKVEEQRRQLEEQEKQVASLRSRIALLEGTADEEQRRAPVTQGGSSVDDFSIKNAASQLERLINRWAADVVRTPPAALRDLYRAALCDITGSNDSAPHDASPMQVQSILRHAMAEVIANDIINVFIVTNSPEANVQLTRIHENLFTRNPVVACVWRRQTFSAAVESCDPKMTVSILAETLPSLTRTLGSASKTTSVLASAYTFSRMVHGAPSSSNDAFYRSFVPELGSFLYPRQIELVRRCLKSERGEQDRVGATIFPGLVKVTKGLAQPLILNQDAAQVVVRRAQVICECALASSGNVPTQALA